MNRRLKPGVTPTTERLKMYTALSCTFGKRQNGKITFRCKALCVRHPYESCQQTVNPFYGWDRSGRHIGNLGIDRIGSGPPLDRPRTALSIAYLIFVILFTHTHFES